MQPVPDLVGGVGVSLPLIAGYQDSPGGHTHKTGSAEPLPDVAHTARLFAEPHGLRLLRVLTWTRPR